MPQPKLTAEDVKPFVELVEKHLRLGARPAGRVGIGKSAIEAASEEAIELGWSRAQKGGTSIVRVRIDAAEKMGVGPDWSLWVAPQYVIPDVSAKLDLVASTYSHPSGKHAVVCVIPDIHVSPRITNERLTWIGRWVAATNPDYVVQIGDWLTLDSLSTHADPSSLEARLIPSFGEDIEAFAESLAAFEKGAPGLDAKKILCKGNHEFRADRFENRNPNMAGSLVPRLDGMFTEAGWRVAPYCEYVFIEGVGFIHHPVNAAGRAYGGKTGAARTANDALHSIVSGHTHQKQSVDVPKIGPNAAVRAITAGTALPWGHVEHYARHSATGWWWGVVSLTIADGLILDEHWVSMLTLQKRFGD